MTGAEQNEFSRLRAVLLQAESLLAAERLPSSNDPAIEGHRNRILAAARQSLETVVRLYRAKHPKGI
jgi:hypothetical protein